MPCSTARSPKTASAASRLPPIAGANPSSSLGRHRRSGLAFAFTRNLFVPNGCLQEAVDAVRQNLGIPA